MNIWHKVYHKMCLEGKIVEKYVAIIFLHSSKKRLGILGINYNYLCIFDVIILFLLDFVFLILIV